MRDLLVFGGLAVFVVCGLALAVMVGAAVASWWERRHPIDLGWRQWVADVRAECAKNEALKRVGR